MALYFQQHGRLTPGQLGTLLLTLSLGVAALALRRLPALRGVATVKVSVGA